MTIRTRLSQEIFEELRQGVIRGDIPQGTELMDTEVALRHDVSRTPAREALLRLEERKLVRKDLSKHQGFIVVRPTAQDIIEVYSLRSVLERFAVELLRFSSDRVSIADKLEGILVHHPTGTEDAAETNNNFHRTIVVCSQHDELIHQHQMLQDRMELYRRSSLQHGEHVNIANRDHERIVELVRQGDPGVGLFVQDHVRAAGIRLLSSYTASSTEPLYLWMNEGF